MNSLASRSALSVTAFVFAASCASRAPSASSSATSPAPVAAVPAPSATAPVATAAPVAPAPVAAAVAPPRLAYLRVHMDRSPVAKVADAESARRQQVRWIASHGAPAGGEITTYWIRVGADRTWSVRPATSWEELKTQGQQLSALDTVIRAAVGAAFTANEDLVHQAIDEHNNELLRPVANLTLAPSPPSPPSPPSAVAAAPSAAAPSAPSASPAPFAASADAASARALAVTELSDLATLRLVAIDKPSPARHADYLAAVEKINAALRATEPTLWRAVYYSGLGSGAYVHFLGADRPLTPAQLKTAIRRALEKSLGAAEAARLLRSFDASLFRRELVPASFSPELSTLPSQPPR